jgi:hypothetical protein
MDQNEFQFHMEEFRALQSERSAVLTRGWNLLQYFFIFSFAFYGWISAAGNRTDGVPRFTDSQWNVVAWIPFLMSVVSLIFSYGLYLRIVQISNYVIRLEGLLAARDLGWERRMSEENLALGTRLFGKPTARTTVYIALSWLVLLFITFVAGVIFTR